MSAPENPMYVINGFYMSMREKFTLDDAKLHYFVVEWAEEKLSWEDFRLKVLGATDPATAEEGSLRKVILDKWQALGLASEPNVGDNGMHASASPFEAMAERTNWLSKDFSLDSDSFAQALIAGGVPKATVQSWTKDPQVLISKDGTKGSLFDALEDMNAAPCLAKAQRLASGKPDESPKKKGTAPKLANEAFVFIKPHAVTDEVVALVKAEFEKKGLKITKEGVLDGPTIGKNKLIDNHYYAIAIKASLTKPKDLNPPEAKQAEFQALFGLSWPEALKKGKVFNALDACAKLGLSGDELDTVWAASKKAKRLVKFGGGFYAGEIDGGEKKTEIKVTNKKGYGFYIRAVQNLLQGASGKDGAPDKPAEQELTVSALGNAISCAVAVATKMQTENVGKITKVETLYPDLQNGSTERGVAQMRIQIQKC